MTRAYPSARLKRIQSRVRSFILEREILPADGRVLVAVSGGPDSTALLVLLARLRRGLRITLHAAHFDHGLRSRRAAREDEAFVRELASSLDVPVTAGHGDVKATTAEHGLSLEDAARRERYAFLARVASETGCTAVATGHTATDQAETVLLHLLRGSGLGGLAGMAGSAPWPFPDGKPLWLVRPLLALQRADTLAVCEEAGLQAMEDETNRLPQYRRNRVRHEVMPLLRQLNPRVEDALVRLAESAGDDYAFILAAAEDLLGTPEDGIQRLPRERLQAAHPSLRRHAFRTALARVAGDLHDFGERHLAALERLVLEGKTGDRLDLPRGVVAELRRDALAFMPAPPGDIEALPQSPLRLTVPGSGRLGCLAVSASSDAPPEQAVAARVDASAVGPRLTVRRRRPGDRFQPLGMERPKKLQDFLVDEHVPRPQRDCIPLFEAERGIAWVGGLRIAEWARPQSGRPSLFLSYQPLDSHKE